MQIWKSLQILMLSVVITSPLLVQCGCSGGGGGGEDGGAQLTPEEDPTTNPEDDSTMIVE